MHASVLLTGHPTPWLPKGRRHAPTMSDRQLTAHTARFRSYTAHATWQCSSAKEQVPHSRATPQLSKLLKEISALLIPGYGRTLLCGDTCRKLCNTDLVLKQLDRLCSDIPATPFRSVVGWLANLSRTGPTDLLDPTANCANRSCYLPLVREVLWGEPETCQEHVRLQARWLCMVVARPHSRWP